MEESFVEKSKISVRPISQEVAKPLIIKNHYSHSWTMCTYALGIYYTSDNQHDFFDERDEKLIGCVVYGNPIGRNAAKAISEELEIEECLELTRLFIFDGYGKNVESLAISLSFEWLRNNASHIKALISYSDPNQNHLGRIYQATNWYYQGSGLMNIMPNYSISLTNNPHKWIHSRSVFNRFGTHNVDKLRKIIGHTFWRKREPFKHRYVYFLCNKREKKKYLKTLKHRFLPYPKNVAQYHCPTEEYVVERSVEMSFF